MYSLVSLAVLGVDGWLVAALPYVFNIPADAVPRGTDRGLRDRRERRPELPDQRLRGRAHGPAAHVPGLTGQHLQRASCESSGTYFLLTNGYGLVGLSLLHLALSLAYAGFVVRYCLVYLPDVPLRPSRPVRAEVVKLLNYGKYVFLANIGDKIVFATDAIVIGMFLPIAALTPYAIAGTLIDSMRSVVRAMASVFNPLTSGLRATGNEQALGRVLQSGAKGAVVVGLPICIGFIILGERFVALWMGEAHAAMAGRVMTILSIGYIVGLPYYTILGILNGLGAHRQFGILRIVEGVFNLAISVTLVNVTGLVGVAFGTAIPHAIMVGWILPRTLPKIFPVNLKEYYFAVYGRTLLASVPFVLACWLVKTVVQPVELAQLLLLGLRLSPRLHRAGVVHRPVRERARARDASHRRAPGPSHQMTAGTRDVPRTSSGDRVLDQVSGPNGAPFLANSRPGRGAASAGKPQRRIKVMLAIDGLGLGGAEMVVRDLARFLDRDWFDVCVCCTKGLGGSIGEEMLRDGIDVFVLPGQHDDRVDYLTALKFRRAVKDRSDRHRALARAAGPPGCQSVQADDARAEGRCTPFTSGTTRTTRGTTT